MKILICDDHKIVRIGLKQILQQLYGVSFIDEAGDGDEAIRQLKNNDFNIVLLDISLPGKNGLEVLQIIKSKWPSVSVLILSMYPQEQYAIRALKLGASGYLTKETAYEELLIAVKRISEGGKYISPSLAENLALFLDKDSVEKKHDLLSKREFEIMIKLANGKALNDIGNELLISIKTVSTYRTRIMEKMELTKNAELAKYCMENKLF
jgi:DNA-binding NarL/FixJ family response regulator